jgi:hypothetical protein
MKRLDNKVAIGVSIYPRETNRPSRRWVDRWMPNLIRYNRTGGPLRRLGAASAARQGDSRLLRHDSRSAPTRGVVVVCAAKPTISLTKGPLSCWPRARNAILYPAAGTKPLHRNVR